MMLHDFRNQSQKHHRKTKTKSSSQHVATIVSAESDWSRDGCDLGAVVELIPRIGDIMKCLGIII